MSAHMKKRPTKAAAANTLYVIDNNTLYAIPKKVAKLYIVEAIKAIHCEDTISADALFESLDKQYGKAAALLRGLRARENLSQVEFAERIDVTQSNLSKMENGTRPIGKIIAKRIAKAFDVDDRYFIE